MSTIEWLLAYGASVYVDGKFPQVRFKALEKAMGNPLRPKIEIFGANKGSFAQLPRLVAEIDNRECIIFRAHVDVTEPWLGIPQVNFVNIHGIDILTGAEIVQTIKP